MNTVERRVFWDAIDAVWDRDAAVEVDSWTNSNAEDVVLGAVQDEALMEAQP